MARPALSARVATFDLATKEQVSQRTINYHLTGSRDWLAKHLHWCLANGHGVQIEAEPVS